MASIPSSVAATRAPATNAVASSGSADPGATRRADFGVIGLIGLAHGTSHFFHLLLPPLFPTFMREFGLGYAQLGLLVTLFFVISGVGQALSGFLVDRIGARPVLLGAMVCFAGAALAAAGAQGPAGLVLAATLAGLGNAPFHPADFTVLNQRVSGPRLGHAFSVHGISGNLGWALAPVFLLGVGSLTGSWRAAYVACALLALGVLVLMLVHRDALDGRARTAGPGSRPASVAAATEHPMAFLRLSSVWLCFSFFFWSTAALSAVQSFGGPSLSAMYALPLSATAFVVTGYMLASAGGMVAGGFLLQRRPDRLEQTIAWAMAGAAALLLLVASGLLPPWAAAGLAAAAGFGSGLAGPSRDMLIRRASPPGATGRVYGTVYSGLDVGFAAAAPVFGALLDRGLPQSVFAGAALALALGIASAAWVGLSTRQQERARQLRDAAGAAGACR